MFLQRELDLIEQYLPKIEMSNDQISSKTVGWQLDHTLRVLIGVSKVLKESDPKLYKRNFNKVRAFVFLFNKIPRGKGKAPKVVTTENPITLESVSILYAKACEELKTLDNLPKHANFDHKYFGMLNLKQTKKFLRIHTQHHLKIVSDILK